MSKKEIYKIDRDLQVLDQKMNRAAEDLIVLLIKKNVIRLEELPVEIQDTITERRLVRQKMKDLQGQSQPKQ